ncbi:integral membrane protein [Streptococcus pneumoniae]|nr:integral membrane protein [Streptococcus pneumoniae]
MLSWLARVIKGIVIALGFILPGISGGVLAAILGIYERMIGFLAHPFKDFKENVLYFIPVAIGMLLGIGLFSYPIEYLLENYQVFVLWSFAGAIIGTVPSLLKESTRESDRDKIDLAWLWTTFIISGLGLYALNFVVGTLSASFLNFVLAGALLALDVLVPGLSPSNLLLILGLYAPMLTGFKTFDFLGTFFPIGIGAGATLIVFSKLMDYALNNYHSRVYHFIIGIVLSSTLLILIPNAGNAESIQYTGLSLVGYVIIAFFFALGIWLGIWMSQLEDKYK